MAGGSSESRLGLILSKNVRLHLSKGRWLQFACVWLMVVFAELFVCMPLLFFHKSSLENKAAPEKKKDESAPGSASWGPHEESGFRTQQGSGLSANLVGAILEAVGVYLGVLCPLSTALRLFGQAIFQEKENLLMEVQFVYGLSKSTYWRANLLFFMLIFGTVFFLANLFGQLLLISLVPPANSEPDFPAGASQSGAARLYGGFEWFVIGFGAFFPVLAALLLGSVFAVLIKKKQAFERLVQLVANLGSLLLLALYVVLEMKLPLRTSAVWPFPLTPHMPEIDPKTGKLEEPKENVQCPSYDLAWANMLIGLIVGIVCPGFSFVRLRQRSYQMLEVLVALRISFFKPTFLSDSDDSKVEIERKQYTGYSVYGCMWKNKPYPDAEEAEWVHSYAGTEAFANTAGMGTLVREVGVQIWAPWAIDVVAVVGNVLFWGLLLYYVEQTRNQAEAGDSVTDEPDQVQKIKNADIKLKQAEGGAGAPPTSSGSQKGEVALAIRSLTKSFNGGQTFANRDLSFEVYRGEIFGLLGHNGAGKTTLVNQLTGMIPTTRGDALVNGHSIRGASIDSVRRSVSLCPQQDPMWDVFSLKEHLTFFARLRGVEEAEIPGVIARYAEWLNLSEKLETLCQDLSGGQKRRMWVLCALLGDASVVILDEPTTGMDPQARRDFWVTLKRMVREENRCVLFSTHYLEEADLLADRKVILAHGRAMALGTSPELKRQWGTGYWIHAVVDRTAPGMTPDAAQSLLHGPLRQAIADELKVEAKGLITKNPRVNPFFLAFSIPWAKVDAMPAVLTRLKRVTTGGDGSKIEAQSLMKSGQHVDVTIEQTTLEEVFTLCGERAAVEELGGKEEAVRHEEQREHDRKLSRLSLKDRRSEGGQQLWGQQLRAVWGFRMATTRRVAVGSLVGAGCFNAGLLLTLALDWSPATVPRFFGFVYYLTPGLLSALAFTCFGLPLVYTRYDEEKHIGFLRHMTMHGVSRRAFHLGSFCYFALLPAGVGWIGFAVAFLVAARAVFATSPGIALVVVVFVVIPAWVLTVVFPMLGYDPGHGLTVRRAWWTILSILAFFGGILQFSIGQIPRGMEHEKSVAWLAERRRERDAKRRKSENESEKNPPKFGSARWKRDQARRMREHEADVRENPYTTWVEPSACRELKYAAMDLRRRGKLEVREKKKNKEEDAKAKAAKSAVKAWSNDAGLLDFGWPLWWNTVFLPLALFLPPVAVGNAFAGLHKLWAYSYFLVGDDDGKGTNPLPPPEPTFLYYSFGQLPLDNLPEKTTKRLAALPAKCGSEFASNTALTQVLAPLWSLLLYLLLFALYEYHVRHLRLAKGRDLPATGLPPRDEQRDADVVKEENRSSRDRDAVDVQAVYKHFVNQKAVAVNEKDRNGNDNAGCCFLLRCCCGCCFRRRSGAGEPGVNWATKGVTLGIQPGESFGLLGPNGAGKTTLFNLMVGSDDIGAPTSGSVRIMNVDAHEDGFKKAAALLGLAPQFDKLIPYATARQHLRLFSKCCGTYYESDGGEKNKSGDGGSSKRRGQGEAEPLLVPSGPGDATTEATDFGERRISRFLREVSLSEKDADRPAEEYSGGMKRKLSVAMTLITDPKVVFLDEMSAGVDIVAQQSLWNKIIHRPRNQTVISTTHSMMEADAVSDRIGILVAGRLKCLGETSRIKSVYGTGYHLELTLAGAEVDKELRATTVGEQQGGAKNQTAAGAGNAVPGGAVAVQMERPPGGGSPQAAAKPRSSTSSIESKIVASLLKYETGAEVAKVRVLEKMWFTGGKTRLKLVLGLGQSLQEKRALNLAAIFQWILADPMKIIEDHSLGEPTLEQVFLKFAKEQEFIDAAAGNPGVFAGEGEAVRRYRRYSENPDVLPAVEGSEGAGEKEGKTTSQAGKKTSEVDNMGSVVDGMMTNEGAGGEKAASGTDDNVGDAGFKPMSGTLVSNANGENDQGAAEVVGNDDASDDDADPEDSEEDDDADPDNES